MQDTRIENDEAVNISNPLENAADQGVEQDHLESQSPEQVSDPALDESEARPQKIEIQVSMPVKVRDFNDVKEAVAEHAAWIESVVNPRKDIRSGRANFKGADLSGYNLAGVDLRGATFTGCTCRGTIFTGANLSGANFIRADLSGADFRGAKLKRAQFEHAVLLGADWDDAITDQANFRYAKRDTKDDLAPEPADECSDTGGADITGIVQNDDATDSCESLAAAAASVGSEQALQDE